jgi:hypothetical protein
MFTCRYGLYRDLYNTKKALFGNIFFSSIFDYFFQNKNINNSKAIYVNTFSNKKTERYNLKSINK